jgi:hypothetical protein
MMINKSTNINKTTTTGLFPIVPLFKILEFWLSHIFFRCWNFLNKHILSQMCLISALLWLYLLIIDVNIISLVLYMIIY